MKTKDSLLLENAYELIQIKQFLLSEGYSSEEIERAIVEEKLGDLMNRAKKGLANAGVAATMGAAALGFGGAMKENPNTPQQQPPISLRSDVAADNPIHTGAFEKIVGHKFDRNNDSDFGPMYVTKQIFNKFGGNGGVDSGTLINFIKQKVSENPNVFNTTDSRALDNVVRSFSSDVANLQKQSSTGGKYGDPTASIQQNRQVQAYK